jgi:hypothetical protein
MAPEERERIREAAQRAADAAPPPSPELARTLRRILLSNPRSENESG